MKRVVIESPYAGSNERAASAAESEAEVFANVAYARRCVVDALRRGEAPYASHLFFTQPGLLDDLVPEERILGMTAGFAWAAAADLAAVYIDRGVSSGMIQGVVMHRRSNRVVVCRSLDRQGELAVEDYLCLCRSEPPVLCPLHLESRSEHD